MRALRIANAGITAMTFVAADAFLEHARAKVEQAMGRRHWQLESYVWIGICKAIAPAFEVSSDVIRRRIVRDRLLPTGVQI